MQETAYAKINLALHVRKRREDGYHELETLFAFVDAGDTLSAHTAEQDQVTTIGEFAGGIDDPFDNLVAKALSVLPRPQGMSITLEKNLPVAAGLGGGSADAGAVNVVAATASPAIPAIKGSPRRQNLLKSIFKSPFDTLALLCAIFISSYTLPGFIFLSPPIEEAVFFWVYRTLGFSITQ